MKSLKLVVLFVEKMHNSFSVFVEPGYARVVLAAYDLFTQGIEGFNEAVVPCINLFCMTFITMLIMHLLACFQLLVRVCTFICVCQETAANQACQGYDLNDCFLYD